VRRRSLVGLAVALSLTVPACARSGAGGAASCPSPTSTNAVNLADFDYDPPCVAARAGTNLTLTDTGRAPHTYTVPGTSLNVKLDPGRTETAALTGVAPGTYAVICEYHPQMRGALVVAEGG
jgi:plastocyanin